MELLIDESNISYSSGPFITISLEASELLYEYGYRMHARSKRDHLKSSIKTYNKYLLEWKKYIAGKSLKKPDFSFSKDLRYIMGSIVKIKRDNPILIRVVKELGVRSHGSTSDKFVIKTIPDNVDWKIRVHKIGHNNYKEALYIKEKDGDEWQEYKG